MSTTLQKIALVQCYIHHTKDIEVNIKQPITMHEKALFNNAYITALNYFNR